MGPLTPAPARLGATSVQKRIAAASLGDREPMLGLLLAQCAISGINQLRGSAFLACRFNADTGFRVPRQPVLEILVLRHRAKHGIVAHIEPQSHIQGSRHSLTGWDRSKLRCSGGAVRGEYVPVLAAIADDGWRRGVCCCLPMFRLSDGVSFLLPHTGQLRTSLSNGITYCYKNHKNVPVPAAISKNAMNRRHDALDACRQLHAFDSFDGVIQAYRASDGSFCCDPSDVRLYC